MTTIDIVGGSIAGLALARGLDPERFRVRIHEARPDAQQLPTVFAMWPSAMRALDALGLADEVRAASVPGVGGAVLTVGGRRLLTQNGGPEIRLVPRPELLRILRASLDDRVAVIGERVDDPTALDGDVIVGADGVHSVVRASMGGRPARVTGAMAVRGVVDGPIEDYGPPMEVWGRRSLFGMTPNAAGLTNWYASMPEFDATPAEALDWCRDHFTQFPAPVRAVLDAATPERTLVNRIWEAPTLRSLARGRCVLLGDAAHAMSPNLGRGACEALVDAVALGDALRALPPAAALSAYSRRSVLRGQAVRVASAAARRIAFAVR